MVTVTPRVGTIAQSERDPAKVAYAIRNHAEILEGDARLTWNARMRYGLNNTGEVDNAVALAAMRTDLAAIDASINYPSGSPGYLAGARSMPKIVFEPGVYAFSAWPNFAFHNLWMEGSGQVELWFRGGFATGVTGNVFGDAFTFDAPAIYGTGIGALNVRFQGFRLVPVGTCSDALVLKAIHHSHFNDLHIQGAGVDFLMSGVHYNCLNLQYCVATEFVNLHISSFDGVTSVTTPISGGTYSTNRGVAFFTLNPPGYLSSDCTFINPVIETLFDGVYFDTSSASGNNFRGGTIEGCVNTGVTIGSSNFLNYFDCIDMESNGTDVVCSSGSQQSAFIHCGGSAFTYTDSGTDNFFFPITGIFIQPIHTKLTPGSSSATLDASGQAGITIAQAANAPIGIGQGVLTVATNMSSTSTSVVILGGGGVANILTGANWELNTTTPAGGNQSIAFDGASFYRIYNNTGAQKVYNVQTFRTG